MTRERVMGWDIGGAHLKAAVLEGADNLRVHMEPCPLWKGVPELTRAMGRILERTGSGVAHAVTMTGELVDHFPDRAQGVRAIVQAVRERLAEEAEPLFFARDGGLLDAEGVLEAPEEVASANWRATAQAVARSCPSALLVDIGSTTSDLVPLRAGSVAAAGDSDAARLRAGELLYTGAVRTPVMALGDRVPVAGAWVPLAAEWFATTADVHRLRGVLPEGADLGPTADGAAADREGSARRLARMVGNDAEAGDPAPWERLAEYLAEMQLRDLLDAAYLVEGRLGLDRDAPVVGAGVGRFLASAMAERLGRPYRDFKTLVAPGAYKAGPDPADCAPAVSLAVLAKGAFE
ncbi:hydantoinase/oxoprolinase family protein [Thiohalorhabdus methylotrophus]|uniref:Hydantoinase/oxoprolinase family protein n=1 Tax=Thiohalorhabdus methylotrophus TaxID=3242694 RepID=A0ABV4TX68_9GAMM